MFEVKEIVGHLNLIFFNIFSVFDT